MSPNAEYYERNKERLCKYARAYYYRNINHIREYQRKNKDKQRRYSREYARRRTRISEELEFRYQDDGWTNLDDYIELLRAEGIIEKNIGWFLKFHEKLSELDPQTDSSTINNASKHVNM